MVLNDTQILERMRGEVPLIEPFNRDALQSESYDLSIGGSILRLSKDFRVLDLRNQSDIDAIYTREPLLEVGSIIAPGEYVLVSTREKINMPCDLTAHVRPRTRYTRVGLLVSVQHCNSTYSGRLTLGIKNETSFAVRIVPGIRVAQILFEPLSSVPSPSSQYANRADSVFQHEEGPSGSNFTTEPFLNNTARNIAVDAEILKAYRAMLKGGDSVGRGQ